MSKKERVQIETTQIPAQDPSLEEEPILETEAYVAPQPEAGSDVTVMKPVGIGGPVPIVAPKHNTIQLQPIVVPLAVVPYMTQDSSVLRTDGRQQPPAYVQDGGEATEFQAVDKEKKPKKVRPKKRLFALLSLVLSLLTVLPFILCYFKVQIKEGINFAEFDTIKVIADLVNHTVKINAVTAIDALNMVVMAMVMLAALFLIIGLIIGKYPKPLLSIFLFIATGCLAAELVLKVLKKAFVLKNEIVFIVMLAVTAIAFVLSIVFSVLINHIEEKAEDQESEI